MSFENEKIAHKKEISERGEVVMGRLAPNISWTNWPAKYLIAKQTEP